MVSEDALMDAVDRLAELVPPPEGVAPVDWAAAEQRFGLRFPQGYSVLVDRYGAGVFGDDFELLVPSDGLVRALELDDQVQRDRVAEGLWRYALRPEAGALVVWLRTGNSTEVHWRIGAEDQEQVYVSYLEDWVQELAGSPAEVLLGFVTGDLVPRDYELGEFEATFEPLDG